MPFQIAKEEEPRFRWFTLDNDEDYWKDFVVPIMWNCHKQSPFVLFVQPSSIDLNNELAILKPIDTWSKTPQKKDDGIW